MNDDTFARSPSSYHANADREYTSIGRFYADQVINSHVRYLDNFRRWAGQRSDGEAAEITKTVIDAIRKYVTCEAVADGQCVSAGSTIFFEGYLKICDYILERPDSRWQERIDRENASEFLGLSVPVVRGGATDGEPRQ